MGSISVAVILRRIVFDFMLQDAEKPNAIADQEVPLIFFGELTAGEDSRCRNGSNTHLKPGLTTNTFADVYIGPTAARAIVSELITPLVKDVAVWIGANRKMKFHFKGARIESMHAAVAGSEGASWSFHRRNVEDAARPVQPAVGADKHRIG